MRATIGECFLVTATQTKLAIRYPLKRVVLVPFHLNEDLWTSKVSHQIFLGVRIFWKSAEQMRTVLLAVTLYSPPKVESKQDSDWLMEYVLSVLKWYGVHPRRAFNVLGSQHGWMWLWCFPHTMH